MKIITVNIESQKHVPEIETFLRHQDADLVFLQEVFETHLPLLAGDQYPFFLFS